MARLWNRNFALWLTGTTSDSLGNALVLIVIPLTGFAITQSAATAGILSMLYAASFAALVLIGGVLVDVYDRRVLMIIRAIIGFVTWGACGWLFAQGSLSTVPFAVLLCVAGAARGLFGTADNAALRSIIEPNELPKAQGAVQAREAAIELAGAPIGALLYGISGQLPFLGAALCMLVFACIAGLLRGDLRPTPGGTTERRGVLAVIRGIPRDLVEGMRFTVSDRLILHAVIIVMLLNFATGLLLQIVTLHFVAEGIAPATLSLLFAVAAAAMLIGAFVSQAVVGRVRGGTLVIIGLCITAACGMFTAAVPTFWGLTGGLAAIGFVVPLIAAVLQGYTAWFAPPRLQGRVLSLLSLISLGLGAFAPLVAGLLVNDGLFRWGLIGAAGLLVVCTIGALLSSPLRKLGRPKEWSRDPASAT